MQDLPKKDEVSNNEFELVRWMYFTSRMLNYFENNRSLNSNIDNAINEYLAAEGFEKQNSFNPFNQGAVIMALYGILVFPKELWNRFLGNDDVDVRDQLLFNDLDLNINDFFEISHPSKINKTTFLRRLRNAIAHSNVSIDMENSEFIFINFDPQTNHCNMTAKSNKEKISKFLNLLSSYFINKLGRQS